MAKLKLWTPDRISCVGTLQTLCWKIKTCCSQHFQLTTTERLLCTNNSFSACWRLRSRSPDPQRYGFYRYALSQKTSPFLFLRYLSHISSDFADFRQKNTPENLKQTYIHEFIHIVFYMFVLYLVKTNDASERTLRRHVIPETRNWHSILYQKIYELAL